MKRREFIILTSVGATSGAMLSACGNPERKLIPALVPDDEYVPGIDYWKAGACALCEAGCGIIVRTREHKASKIEGNPLHPVNRGALCARGQAGLQALYNPDRISSPLRRAGERGAGQFEQISWDEAIKTLAGRLREIKARGAADSVVFLSGASLAVSRLAAERFMSAYGARLLVSAHEAASSPSTLFDIAGASYLLSFGARFLETWQSPVMYSLAYGEFRRSSNRSRGKFVHVEPRMSLTAANADEWLPAAPGSEGLVALAIAQVILREGLIKNAAAPGFIREPIEAYAPEQTASLTDIPADRLIGTAREFALSARPLALAGGSALTVEPVVEGLNNHAAIEFLNLMVGNLNKPGGVLAREGAAPSPLDRFRPARQISWLPLDESTLGSHTSALLLHHANPAHTSPWSLDAIKAVLFIASFSSFMDETTQMADLILPDHTYLESWDIRSAHTFARETAVTLARPVIRPRLDTRQTADALIALIRELEPATAQPVPFDSAEAMVRQAAAELQRAGGSISVQTPDDFWNAFTERGVWVGSLEPVAARHNETAFHIINDTNDRPARQRHEQARAVNRYINRDDYPLTLLAYEHAALGYGEQANLPSLQELPDPMTTVMWGSWVEINPKTAAAAGIADGDLVEVETAHGSARVPAVIYPAIRPDVIAMPYGQGHTAYGRYAVGRGANAAALDPFALGPRAKISKVEGPARLARFGANLPEHVETER
jgi:anaerobic selenocysteine-containing dehydrogenase